MKMILCVLAVILASVACSEQPSMTEIPPARAVPLTMPAGLRVYVALDSIDICQDWPHDLGHWGQILPGELVAFGDHRWIEGMVSQGVLLPVNLTPGGAE